MKNLNYGNLAIVFSLIFSLILCQFNPDFTIIAFVLGLYIMPAYQLLVGLIWIVSNNNKRIRIYFIGVLTYFITMFCNNIYHNIGSQKISEQIITYLGATIPIALSLYFTYILNQYSRK
jgi:hypothetical protein